SSDVVVAREILFRDGYLPAYTFRSGQAVAQIRFLRACRLDRPGDRMHIWLQTEIEPGCFARRLDFARLEHRARMLRLGLGTVCTIGPEDLLLTLCAYLMRQTPPGLGALADIANLVGAHPSLDWEYTLRWARDLGAHARLSASLSLARSLFRCPIPEEAAAQMGRDARAAQLAVTVREAMTGAEHAPPALIAGLRFQCACRERLRDRVRAAVRAIALPSEDDWAFVAPPAWWPSLSYLVRP